jgi:hypothetical protein
MSRSCGLFNGGPRKRHTRALGFESDLNLGIGGPCDGFDGVCWGVLAWPIGPLGFVGLLDG